MAKNLALAPPVKRRYNSSRRALQAAQTRRDVLLAAVRLFQANGWTGTTLAAVADEAGVAVETVYNAFGSKKGLLRAAIDVAVVGDVEPVPFAERPEFFALGEGTLEERIAKAAALNHAINERSAGVWQAIASAASSDAEVDAWRVAMEQSRRLDIARSAERVLGAAVDDRLVTALWLLYSADSYLKLVADEGMSAEDYQAFIADATRRLGVAERQRTSTSSAKSRSKST